MVRLGLIKVEELRGYQLSLLTTVINRTPYGLHNHSSLLTTVLPATANTGHSSLEVEVSLLELASHQMKT